MPRLYPRLEATPALEGLVRAQMLAGVDACRPKRATAHPEAIYSPVGGLIAEEGHLLELATGLDEVARRHGYPEPLKKEKTGDLDRDWMTYLHRKLELTPHEASHDSMWHFMTIVLVPDLTLWRWSCVDGAGNMDRWLTVRYRHRNTFGRLWWRMEMLKTDGEDGVSLATTLKEDDLIQILERPWIVGHHDLLQIYVKRLISIGDHHEEVSRKVHKNLLRLGTHIEYEALDHSQLEALVEECFMRALKEMGKE